MRNAGVLLNDRKMFRRKGNGKFDEEGKSTERAEKGSSYRSHQRFVRLKGSRIGASVVTVYPDLCVQSAHQLEKGKKGYFSELEIGCRKLQLERW